MALHTVKMVSFVRLQLTKLNINLARNLSSVGLGKETALDNDESNTVSPAEARLKDMPIPDMLNPFEREKAQCILCKYKINPDYKNVKLLSQFVSPYTGRIYGRHITGLCSMQQKRVEKEICKSQNSGFMAYYLKQVEFLKDPKLFDPEHPIRPHRF